MIMYELCLFMNWFAFYGILCRNYYVLSGISLLSMVYIIYTYKNIIYDNIYFYTGILYIHIYISVR